MYFNRLRLMQFSLRDAAENKWNSGEEITPIVDKVIDLVEGKPSILLGTVFKEMSSRPSVIQQYANDRTVKTLTKSRNYTHDKDSLILEDNSGRIRLVGSQLPVHKFVTGLIAGFKGVVQSDGKFDVHDYCFVGYPHQMKQPTITERKYVAFVSGLDIGSQSKNHVAMELLLEYITGNIGGTEDMPYMTSIQRLVIAGNALMTQQLTEGVGKQVAGIREKETQQSLADVRELDVYLAQLSSSIAVDIMPGERDSANFSLPQQPLHKCLLPQSSKFSSFSSTTNPHMFSVEGVDFLGTSGQTIDNLMMFGRFESPLEAAELTLEWAHIAPTCPDSMSSYPYSSTDPFILKKCPHVYFIGNQDSFCHKRVKGPDGQLVQIVCIPSFSQTGIMVLVDLQTLDCETVSFGSI
eukprot:TRINITY_DN8972_c0_g1_i1.p1 TRINITY_DN8972_c0_g1~~TRINITY_DN8972_c0_g1_i1.p1  ORF type:complete len:408 (+),score=89.56 TRINITY_DN8972_c0_g1_i1:404-1627(+)